MTVWCPQCEAEFNTTSLLQWHLKRRHRKRQSSPSKPTPASLSCGLEREFQVFPEVWLEADECDLHPDGTPVTPGSSPSQETGTNTQEVPSSSQKEAPSHKRARSAIIIPSPPEVPSKLPRHHPGAKTSRKHSTSRRHPKEERATSSRHPVEQHPDSSGHQNSRHTASRNPQAGHHPSSSSLRSTKKSKQDTAANRKQLQPITECQKPDNYWQLQDPHLFFMGAPSSIMQGTAAQALRAVRDQARRTGRRSVTHLPLGVSSIQRQERAILEGGRVYEVITTWTLNGQTTSWTSEDSNTFQQQEEQ